MAIETRYITFPQAMFLHVKLMRHCGEIRYGVFSRDLVESALARPQQAAVYENADIIRQAATLCFGLIKNHPWVGGNKRTATYLTRVFLLSNGWNLQWSAVERIELCLAVESDHYGVDEIESNLRLKTLPAK